MLSLVLIFLLVWFILTVILAAWTMWFQGYIYSEPAGEIYWRAPAAGTALTLFLALWAMIDFKSAQQDPSFQGHYRELQGFSTEQDLPPFKELRIINRDYKEEVFKLHKNARGLPEYLRSDGRPLPSRPDKIIVVEADKKYVFEPDKDEKGNFKAAPQQNLRYRDKESGWEMQEGSLGQVTISKKGWLFGNLLLNAMHLVVWFACLWLLLRFQWSHALGLAFVFWLLTTLFAVPPLLTRAETLARERATATTAP